MYSIVDRRSSVDLSCRPQISDDRVNNRRWFRRWKYQQWCRRWDRRWRMVLTMRQTMFTRINVAIVSTIEQFQVEGIWREMYFITHCQFLIWILKSYYHLRHRRCRRRWFPRRTSRYHRRTHRRCHRRSFHRRCHRRSSIVGGLELQAGGLLMYTAKNLIIFICIWEN